MNATSKQALLGKTVERLTRTNIERPSYFVGLIHQAADIAGIESVFQRIIERDDETALDHLAEIRYGLLFRSLGFLTRFEPTGSKGPDLLVEREGVSAFVEVKRYRPKEGEHIPESFGPFGTLLQYGDAQQTQNRIAQILIDKLRQIQPQYGIEHGILALWSDREFYEAVDFECAVRQISSEATRNGVQFCVFGSDDVELGSHKRFHCEPVALLPTFNGWMEDIEAYSGFSLR